MNKGELIAAMADKAGVSQKDAGACLDAMMSTIETEIGNGGEVGITGYLKFERAATSARVARNPQTGEAIDVPAGTRCKVTVGAKLKAAGKS
ncbi:MAG: HU family DNA-binding protein [Acidimicrobiaceae bacterium]|nr:HU family DNA-binding protein [Acidimicrobiia bacterium]MCY4494104.1 HU family DNA-binding protein [Acidimicrobiaceae bacterium]